jgi:hypothetical protein
MSLWRDVLKIFSVLKKSYKTMAKFKHTGMLHPVKDASYLLGNKDDRAILDILQRKRLCCFYLQTNPLDVQPVGGHFTQWFFELIIVEIDV